MNDGIERAPVDDALRCLRHLIQCPEPSEALESARRIERDRWQATFRQHLQAGVPCTRADAAKVHGWEDDEPIYDEIGNLTGFRCGSIYYGPKERIAMMQNEITRLRALAAHDSGGQGRYGEHEAEVKADRQWIAGAKFGWNCAEGGERERFDRAIESRIHERALAAAPAESEGEQS